ncbi:MAG: hypothetical protein JO064_00020 [Actinobacteria bacterium]|nr:hypothetical protein [Actinomycetota bacterium]
MELLVVMVILGVLVAIAIPSYMAFTGKAKVAAGLSNVRAALPAAEGYYEANSNFHGISGASLAGIVKGLSPNLKAVSLNSDAGFCIEDSEDGGTTTYDYVGGDPGTSLQTGFKASTVQSGTCAAATGVSGAA